MKKVVNTNASIYEIVKTYPEIVSVLKDLGFESILVYDNLLNEGRITTIPNYINDYNLDYDLIKNNLKRHHYDLRPK